MAAADLREDGGGDLREGGDDLQEGDGDLLLLLPDGECREDDGGDGDGGEVLPELLLGPQ